MSKRWKAKRRRPVFVPPPVATIPATLPSAFNPETDTLLLYGGTKGGGMAEFKEYPREPLTHAQANKMIRDTAEFWRGAFGTEYTQRNRVDFMDRVPFWKRILDATQAESFLDIGCNAGWNLQALKHVTDNKAQMAGIDLNEAALMEARSKGFEVDLCAAHEIGTFYAPGSCDMAITSGVLIHIPPEDLEVTMRAIAKVSSRWVVAIEYQSDEEREIDYRGHKGKLWARPFGKLYQEIGLSLVETGPAEGFDNCHYWLMEKT